jgi:membrane protease YdiL (CAAX protease family)
VNQVVLTILCVVGAAAVLFAPLALFREGQWKFVFAMIAYVLVDTSLTFLPVFVPAAKIAGLSMNWVGKIAAMTFALAMLVFLRNRGFSADQVGLRMPEWRSLLAIAAAVCAFVVLDRLVMGGDPGATREQIAFQSTMPGLAEEFSYRGVLFALAVAAIGKGDITRFPVAAVISTSALFGFIHGLQVTPDGQVNLHFLYMILPAVTGGLLCWARHASKSVLTAVVAHNVINVAHYVGV